VAARKCLNGTCSREGGVFQNVEPPYRGTAPHSLFALIGFIGLCLLVGVVDGGISAGSVRAWYLSLIAPPATPPSWLFAPVWTALHVMIGTAAWLVWREVGTAWPLRLWGWQLLANALWSPAFFGLRSPPLALAVIAVLLVLIALTIRTFERIDRRAAWLMLPYGVWVTYAAYLNVGFWWLNPS